MVDTTTAQGSEVAAQIAQLMSEMDARLPKAKTSGQLSLTLTPEQFDSLTASW